MTSAVLCLSLLTGCQLGSRTSSVPEEEGAVTAYAVDFEADGTMLDDYGYYSTELAFLEDYNSAMDSSRQIQIQYFPNIETMNRQLSTELLSGGGPDLFVFRDTTLPQFQSYATQGVFAPLDTFLEKNSYNKDWFQKVIFDYGTVDGTQRFIPLEYGIPVCITTQSLYDEFELENTATQINYQNYFGLLNTTGTLGKPINSNFNQFWFSELDSFRYRLLPAFIDKQQKEGQFTSAKFKESMEWYLQVVKAQNGRDGFSKAYGTAYASALRDGNLFFYNDPMMSDRFLSVRIDSYFGNTESKNIPLLSFPMKEYAGNDVCGFVGKMVAINDNSSRKNKAWEVIDYALSPNFQNSMANRSSPITGNPIRIEGQERNRENWLSFGSAEMKEIREDFVDQYYELLNSVTKCDCLTYNSMYVQEIFDPLYLEYESGTKTLDEFIKELQNKTGLYLKEQN